MTKRIKLATILAVIFTCLALPMTLASCGDDNDVENPDKDPINGWIIGGWQLTNEVTKYENDQEVDHRLFNFGTVRFLNNGNIVGMDTYDMWKLQGDMMTLSSSNNKAKERLVKITRNNRGFFFTFKTDVTIENGVRKYAVEVLMFRR